ncbi:MAG: class I SAM-dependent methyltransferase [Sphingomonadales bacterium]|nr:class I SAM-dependent methyltransferase [Sphingomonadales bacterium]
MKTCRVCHSSGDFERIIAHEKMFGTGEPFPYFLCAMCGCLQIENLPAKIERYYQGDYYTQDADGRLKRWLKGQRIRAGTGHWSPIGHWASRRFGKDPISDALLLGKLEDDSPILDVGCGGGRHLWPLHAAGYSQLTGIDPFLSHEYSARGIDLKRCDIEDLDSRFRLVMFHHAFEHMPDPHAILDSTRKLVADDGVVLIRVPVLGYGWRTYGTDWVELDAPRHYFLHTETSLTKLLEAHQFSVAKVIYDSTSMEIWGSEQYRRGISHRAQNSYDINPAASVFKADDDLTSLF